MFIAAIDNNNKSEGVLILKLGGGNALNITRLCKHVKTL